MEDRSTSVRRFYTFQGVNRTLYQNVNQSFSVRQFTFDDAQVLECRDGVGKTEHWGKGWICVTCVQYSETAPVSAGSAQGFMSIDVMCNGDLKASMFSCGNVVVNKSVSSVVGTSQGETDSGAVLLTLVAEGGTLQITKVENRWSRTPSDGLSVQDGRRVHDDERRKKAAPPPPSAATAVVDGNAAATAACKDFRGIASGGKHKEKRRSGVDGECSSPRGSEAKRPRHHDRGDYVNGERAPFQTGIVNGAATPGCPAGGSSTLPATTAPSPVSRIDGVCAQQHGEAERPGDADCSISSPPPPSAEPRDAADEGGVDGTRECSDSGETATADAADDASNDVPPNLQEGTDASDFDGLLKSLTSLLNRCKDKKTCMDALSSHLQCERAATAPSPPPTTTATQTTPSPPASSSSVTPASQPFAAGKTTAPFEGSSTSTPEFRPVCEIRPFISLERIVAPAQEGRGSRRSGSGSRRRRGAEGRTSRAARSRRSTRGQSAAGGEDSVDATIAAVIRGTQTAGTRGPSLVDDGLEIIDDMEEAASAAASILEDLDVDLTLF